MSGIKLSVFNSGKLPVAFPFKKTAKQGYSAEDIYKGEICFVSSIKYHRNFKT